VEKGADVTVGVVEVPREQARGFGVMTTTEWNRVIKFAEKPAEPDPMPGRPDVALASMGIYVFNTRLLELASHGYLVIASGRILSGPGAHAATTEQKPFPRTETSDLTKAIDWALAENTRQGSPYFGRIDPQQVAVSGFSCGGLQAALVARDPRVKTLIMQNTGTYDGERATMPGLKVPKSTVKTYHTPVLYILGGPTDVAYKNGMEDFQLIDHVPVAVANLPVGHGGTYHEPNGGAAAQVAVDWLNWQLRGDAQAATRFVGDQCGLCTDEKWTIERKNFPAR